MMNENAKTEYLRRIQLGMRAMTDAEIAEIQKRQAPMMINASNQMRGGAGMQNFLRPNEAHLIPEPQKPTFWQRLFKRMLRPTRKRNEK